MDYNINLMGKKIVCIFAHPDDEAFGPGGTIALLAKKNDVYILCATKGEAGQHHNPKLLEKIKSQKPGFFHYARWF